MNTITHPKGVGLVVAKVIWNPLNAALAMEPEKQLLWSLVGILKTKFRKKNILSKPVARAADPGQLKDEFGGGAWKFPLSVSLAKAKKIFPESPVMTNAARSSKVFSRVSVATAKVPRSFGSRIATCAELPDSLSAVTARSIAPNVLAEVFLFRSRHRK